MYLIKNFYKSIIDFKYYKELFKEKTWKAFLYIFILAIILGAIAYIPVGQSNKAEYVELHKIISENSPEFTITKDSINVEAETPYVIYDEDDKGKLIMIDDTGTIDEYAYDEYAFLFFILKDRLLIKSYIFSDSVKYDYIFSFLPDTSITKATLLSYLELLQTTNIVFIMFLVAFFTIATLFGAFVITAFGRVVTLFRKKVNMKFKDAFKLACYASTVPMIATAIIIFFSISFPYLQLIYILLGILYFINATNYIYPKIEEAE